MTVDEGHFVRNSFGAVADRYDDVFDASAGLRSINHRELSIVVDRLGDVRGRRVLDAGMGTGRVARALVDLGAQVVGVDLTSEMLARSRRRAPEAAAVIARVGAPLPFADQSFDDAVCIRVLKYFREWPLAFDQFRRVLRPGGRIVVEIANSRSLARWGYPGRPINLTTVADSDRLLRQAGFLPIALDAGVRLPYPLYRRSGERAASVLDAAERAGARVLGGTLLARSFFVTAELNG